MPVFDVESPSTELCITRRDESEDWWCIERQDHADERRMDSMSDGNGTYFAVWTSGRLGSGYTDIEGYSREMIAIADAIESKSEVSFARCAAEWIPNGVLLWSPRNSRSQVVVTHAQAEALARDIREKIGGNR